MASNESKWRPEDERARRNAAFKADVALIGSDAMSRLVFATELRRKGVSVFSELQDRKRDKMYKRARDEAHCVLDLDTEEGQREYFLLNEEGE